MSNPNFSSRIWAMWLWTGTLLLTLALLLTGVLSPGDLTQGGLRLLLSPSTAPMGYWLAGMLIIALALTVFTIVALRREEQRYGALTRENDDLRQELRQTKNQLAYTEHLMVTDPITGIPNFRSWERHAEAWTRGHGARRTSCLIVVDLDNLKWLNDTSHDCANQVLETFASRTFNSMRRNEHAFKVPDKNGPQESPQHIEMFRAYAGGDEFIFHLSDDPLGAVGFLLRLLRDCAKYEREIKLNVLPEHMDKEKVENYRLTFCAAIVPINPGAQPSDLVSPAFNLLTSAKKNARSRVMIQADRVGRSLPDELKSARRDQQELEEEVARIRATDNASEIERAKPLEEQLHNLETRISLLVEAEAAFARPQVTA